MEEDEGRLLEEGEIPPIPLVKYECKVTLKDVISGYVNMFDHNLIIRFIY